MPVVIGVKPSGRNGVFEAGDGRVSPPLTVEGATGVEAGVAIGVGDVGLETIDDSSSRLLGFFSVRTESVVEPPPSSPSLSNGFINWLRVINGFRGSMGDGDLSLLDDPRDRTLAGLFLRSSIDGDSDFVEPLSR